MVFAYNAYNRFCVLYQDVRYVNTLQCMWAIRSSNICVSGTHEHGRKAHRRVRKVAVPAGSESLPS